MKLSQIRKNPNNPRIIRDEKFEKLKRSIQDFPQMMALRPIIVDEAGVILGGNMRYEAIKSLKMAEFPDEWVKRVEELTEDQKKEFIVKDNVGFGEWDWDAIANEWDELPLDDWGLDLPTFTDSDELTDNFALKDGDREPFQQMTFTLADEQAQELQQALKDAQHLEAFKYAPMFGNENSNGNALYFIVLQWQQQRT